MWLDGPGPRLRRASLKRTGGCRGGSAAHTDGSDPTSNGVPVPPPPFDAPGQALSALSGPRPRYADRGRGRRAGESAPRRGLQIKPSAPKRGAPERKARAEGRLKAPPPCLPRAGAPRALAMLARRTRLPWPLRTLGRPPSAAAAPHRRPNTPSPCRRRLRRPPAVPPLHPTATVAEQTEETTKTG